MSDEASDGVSVADQAAVPDESNSSESHGCESSGSDVCLNSPAKLLISEKDDINEEGDADVDEMLNLEYDQVTAAVSELD